MEDVRNNIIHTACDLFVQYGIKSVSIDDICKQLGMSKKTFYTYFPQKEDLVEAMLAVNREHARVQMEENIRKYNTEERIFQLENILHKLDDVRHAPPLVFDLQKYYPLLFRKHMELVLEGMRRDCAVMIRQGMDEGLFRKEINVELTADFMARMHNMFVDMSHEENGSRMIRHGVEVLVRGLLTEQGVRLLETARDKISTNEINNNI